MHSIVNQDDGAYKIQQAALV